MINSTTTCTGTDVLGTINETCTTEYETSTSPLAFNGFTQGEIVMISIAFLVLITTMTILYHIKFRRIKIKNQ